MERSSLAIQFRTQFLLRWQHKLVFGGKKLLVLIQYGAAAVRDSSAVDFTTVFRALPANSKATFNKPIQQIGRAVVF